MPVNARNILDVLDVLRASPFQGMGMELETLLKNAKMQYILIYPKINV